MTKSGKRTLSEAVAHAERVLKEKDRLREQAIATPAKFSVRHPPCSGGRAKNP